MAHTPGPWSINGWDIVQQDCDSTFPPLATVCNGNRSLTLEAIDANARLMAAAPELLAALIEVADGCKYRLRKGEDAGDRATLRLCRAAIAKATGKESE